MNTYDNDKAEGSLTDMYSAEEVSLLRVAHGLVRRYYTCETEREDGKSLWQNPIATHSRTFL